MSDTGASGTAPKQATSKRRGLWAFFTALGDIDPSDDPRKLTRYELSRLDSFRALIFLLRAMFIGMVLNFLYALGLAATGKEFLRIFTLTLMIAGAAFAGGIMLGFLFGIPRAMQRNENEDESRDGRRRTYRANTNLEEISDWLTKILVGVGLTQIGKLPDTIKSLSNFLADGIAGKSESFEVFSVLVATYFVVCGFLFSYLWARLFMGSMLRLAEEAIEAKVDKLAEEQVEVQKRDEAEVKVSELVRQQLERSTDDTQIEVDELGDALKIARISTRLDLFDRVRNLRRLAWREKLPDIRPIERTIPIFQALAQTDTEGIRHRTYGEIGFALKDIQLARRALVQDDPEAWMQRDKWQAAAKALAQAITIRKQQGDDIGHLYEVNRAVCNVVLDEQFRTGQPSTPAGVQKIVADLQYALTDPHPWIFRRDLRNPDWMNEHKIVQQWLRLNENNLPDALKSEIAPPDSSPAKDAAAEDEDEAAE